MQCWCVRTSDSRVKGTISRVHTLMLGKKKHMPCSLDPFRPLASGALRGVSKVSGESGLSLRTLVSDTCAMPRLGTLSKYEPCGKRQKQTTRPINHSVSWTQDRGPDGPQYWHPPPSKAADPLNGMVENASRHAAGPLSKFRERAQLHMLRDGSAEEHPPCPIAADLPLTKSNV